MSITLGILSDEDLLYDNDMLFHIKKSTLQQSDYRKSIFSLSWHFLEYIYITSTQFIYNQSMAAKWPCVIVKKMM